MSAFYSFVNSLTNSVTSKYDIKGQVGSAGLWKIYSATRKTTNQQVSVFIFEKKLADVSLGGRKGAGSLRNSETEKIYEVLKSDAARLTRLRHPAILQVVEPISESRAALVFVTEPILGSLSDLMGGQRDGHTHSVVDEEGKSHDFELDELEIQKGFLQLGKGLQFLHLDAKAVHTNLVPEAVFVNAKGDWKIGGLGFSIFLNEMNRSTDTLYDYQPHLPAFAQRNLDYLAPEFVLEDKVDTANDMFSLGCLIYSVYNKAATLMNTFGNLRTYEKKVSALQTLDYHNLPAKLRDLMRLLVTRDPRQRISAVDFQKSSYFESILLSTIKYMENFPEKSREEKIQFMKGLNRVLGQFPKRVLLRKILPTLLEELKDHQLLPFTLPNIFTIADDLNPTEFTEKVLPSLKFAFTVREPPQNMLVLLEKIDLLLEKSPREAFRDDVMPLIYAALETPNPVVQEKALKTVPKLCQNLDYTTVKANLFPKIQALFVQTTILSVKVSTLICFHAMLQVLDKYTMQEKLVPLLRNIKTREPAVMLATLAVYDEMGKHLDIEVVATQLLPALWIMSFGPLLNVDQFKKFMKTIKEMSNRIEEQHTRHLQEMQHLEDQTRHLTTQMATISDTTNHSKGSQEDDFASLVSGANKEKNPLEMFANDDKVSLPDLFSSGTMNAASHELPRDSYSPRQNTSSLSSSSILQPTRSNPTSPNDLSWSSNIGASLQSSLKPMNALNAQQSRPTHGIASIPALKPPTSDSNSTFPYSSPSPMSSFPSSVPAISAPLNPSRQTSAKPEQPWSFPSGVLLPTKPASQPTMNTAKASSGKNLDMFDPFA
ncbi:hypothetical protein BZG36_01781 [Bifiguratus adelaidae]|uniref:Protein kinase domain-containing protein n=1 Tax=Bifiguratus adelaidae TaxID=1938954 RepID=A0A261Y2J7_9FUNG|nr:hypothetical protein BZG36_01781 [Bifiguratus adelaidae]